MDKIFKNICFTQTAQWESCVFIREIEFVMGNFPTGSVVSQENTNSRGTLFLQ